LDDELDDLLRGAMAARPDAPAPSNLAARAIDIARATDAELAAVARVNRWNRFVTAMAAVVIIALAAWVLHARWSAGGFQAWSETSSDSSTTTTTSTVSSDTQQWMFIGIGVAVAAVGILATQRTIGGSDEWMLKSLS
jgi:hypothetical protein